MTHYVHMKLNDGHVTAAYRPNESGLLEVGLAFCSPRDQFSRKKGRLIAEGRMDVRPLYFAKAHELAGDHRKVRQLINMLSESHTEAFPHWAWQ